MAQFISVFFLLFSNQANGQTVEFKKNENYFSLKADPQRITLKNAVFEQTIDVRSCNQKRTQKLLADLLMEEKILKRKTVVFNKAHWVAIDSRKYYLLPFSNQAKRIERFPTQFTSYAIESKKECEDKKRKLTSEEVASENTLDSTIAAPSSPQRQCVDALCSSHIYETYKLKDNLVLATSVASADFNSEIGPTLTANLEAETEQFSFLEERTRQWLSQDGFLRNSYEKKLFSISVAMNLQDRFVIEQNQIGELIVNRAATLAANPSFSARAVEDYASILERIFRSIIGNTLAVRPWETITLAYSTQEVSDKIKEMISSIDSFLAEPALRENWQLISHLPGFEHRLDTKRLRKTLDSGVTRELYEEIQNSLQAAIVLNLVTTTPEPQGPMNVNTIVRDFFPDNIKPTSMQEAQTTAQTTCLVTFSAARILLPTRKEISESQRRLAEVKRQFLAKLTSIYSITTARSIQQAALPWKFVLPPSKDTFPETMRRALNFQRESSVRKLTELQKSSQTKNSLIYAVHATSLKSYDEVFSTPKVCSDITPNLIDDAASIVSPNIRVSPLSIKAGGIADGIVRHELAHKVFYNLKSNRAMSAHSQMVHTNFKDCLQSLHLPKTQSYLEEDYADFVSALTGEKNNESFVCLMVREGSSDYSLRQNGTDDSHSNLFFRLLHTNAVTGKRLPASCEQAQQIESEHAKIQNCRP